MSKVKYDIIVIGRYRGSRNLKVFIYEDDEFVDWLWMDRIDLRKNKEREEKDGNEVEIVESYKDKT